MSQSVPVSCVPRCAPHKTGWLTGPSTITRWVTTTGDCAHRVALAPLSQNEGLDLKNGTDARQLHLSEFVMLQKHVALQVMPLNFGIPAPPSGSQECHSSLFHHQRSEVNWAKLHLIKYIYAEIVPTLDVIYSLFSNHNRLHIVLIIRFKIPIKSISQQIWKQQGCFWHMTFFDGEISLAIATVDGINVYVFYWETATVQTTTNGRTRPVLRTRYWTSWPQKQIWLGRVIIHSPSVLLFFFFLQS